MLRYCELGKLGLADGAVEQAVNYYNYFTEIEEHFRHARNSGMFMMSPLDWALVEAWKDGGVPLEAVLKGIDRAFEKFHARKRRYTAVNSVAYCAQEVMGAAKEAASAGTLAAQRARPGFESSQLTAFFLQRAGQLRRLAAEGQAGREVFQQTAMALEGMAEKAESGELGNLEDVEQRLTVLEDRVFGVATSAVSEEQLLSARRDMDARLRPYRRKMAAEQIAMLEQHYLRRRSLEDLGLSRLSLFYVE